MRWTDVDLLAGTVHVTGKFGRERVLEVSRDIRRQIAAVDHDGRYVFITATGRPYTAGRVSYIVNDHLRRCAAGCTAHQLRHRFATTALRQCGDIAVVRDLMGHTSVATTELYAQVTPGATGKVSQTVDVPGL